MTAVLGVMSQLWFDSGWSSPTAAVVRSAPPARSAVGLDHDFTVPATSGSSPGYALRELPRRRHRRLGVHLSVPAAPPERGTHLPLHRWPNPLQARAHTGLAISEHPPLPDIPRIRHKVQGPRDSATGEAPFETLPTIYAHIQGHVWPGARDPVTSLPRHENLAQHGLQAGRVACSNVKQGSPTIGIDHVWRHTNPLSRCHFPS